MQDYIGLFAHLRFNTPLRFGSPLNPCSCRVSVQLYAAFVLVLPMTVREFEIAEPGYATGSIPLSR